VSPKNEFKSDRTVEFEYVRIKGWWLALFWRHGWRLRKKRVDAEIKREVGRRVFAVPSIIPFPEAVDSVFREWDRLLAQKDLYKFRIHEVHSDDTYSIVITVRRRPKKPVD